MMKFLFMVILMIVIAGCTLVSMTTQVTIGNDDQVEDTTDNAGTVELGGKPLIGVNQ